MKVTYDQLVAIPESTLIERYFKVLQKNGVRSDLLDRVKYYSVEVQDPLSSVKDKELSEHGVKRCYTSKFFIEKHVAILAEILTPHSSKWQNICTALHLPHNLNRNRHPSEQTQSGTHQSNL